MENQLLEILKKKFEVRKGEVEFDTLEKENMFDAELEKEESDLLKEIGEKEFYSLKCEALKDYLDFLNEQDIEENAVNNGGLSYIVNKRNQFNDGFPELMDQFFDQEEIAKKYDAWIEEEDEDGNIIKEYRDTDISNSDIENLLDVEDLKKYVEHWKNIVDFEEDQYFESFENDFDFDED